MNKPFLLVLALGLGAVYYTQTMPDVYPPYKQPAPVSTRTLYLFTKSGCAPCARLKKELDDPILREKIAPWRIEEVSSSLRARRYKVGAFPTLVAEVQGSEVGRKEGYQTKSAIMDWLEGLDDAKATAAEAVVGGPVHADGTEITCDFPGELHRENTSSKGLGNCVFTSIHHAALWQNVPALQEFPKWLIEKGIPGGGYPAKVEKLIPQIAKDRGLPTPEYIQIENCDHETLMLAFKTGRMVSCTYSKSPTGRYGGSRIAHMVSLVHACPKHVVVLDNNYPGYSQFEWITPEEAKRAGVYEWIVVLMDPPPPPAPIGR